MPLKMKPYRFSFCVYHCYDNLEDDIPQPSANKIVFMLKNIHHVVTVEAGIVRIHTRWSLIVRVMVRATMHWNIPISLSLNIISKVVHKYLPFSFFKFLKTHLTNKTKGGQVTRIACVQRQGARTTIGASDKISLVHTMI